MRVRVGVRVALLHLEVVRFGAEGTWPSSDGSVERSTLIMKARDCFWYGRSVTDERRPAGAGASIG